jgi:uncharacterized protein
MLRPLVERIRRPVRYNFLQVLRTKGSPHSTALGMGVGVFVGFLPIIPFQTVVALTLAFALRCGKVCAVIGTLVTNPLNIPLMYFLFYKAGSFFIPVGGYRFDPRNIELASLILNGWKVVLVMFLGGLLFAIPCSVVAYFLTLFTIRRYHALRAQRLLSKRERQYKAGP